MTQTTQIPVVAGQVKTIHELLGLERAEFVAEEEGSKASAPLDLPTLDAKPAIENKKNGNAKPQAVDAPLSFWARDSIRYPLIFLGALAFFFAMFNMRAIVGQVSGWIGALSSRSDKNTAVLSQDYQKWLKKYYVFAGDPSMFLPQNDADGDGLSNQDEYKLDTNPLKADTDEDGYSDGREVLGSYNPLYSGKMTEAQMLVVSKSVDIAAVESRRNVERIAGRTTGLYLDEFALDPSRKGAIRIPKLGIETPIIWSKKFEDMENDLKMGTAHHPGTVYPGVRGLSSIHGHSSGNPDDGGFKTIFSKLNFLEAGDEILVKVYDSRGEAREYRYLARSKKVFAKSDKAQFKAPADGYFLNLSTSWPVGTARQRFVVTTELVGAAE